MPYSFLFTEVAGNVYKRFLSRNHNHNASLAIIRKDQSTTHRQQFCADFCLVTPLIALKKCSILLKLAQA